VVLKCCSRCAVGWINLFGTLNASKVWQKNPYPKNKQNLPHLEIRWELKWEIGLWGGYGLGTHMDISTGLDFIHLIPGPHNTNRPLSTNSSVSPSRCLFYPCLYLLLEVVTIVCLAQHLLRFFRSPGSCHFIPTIRFQP